ncbi:MAG: nitrite/sulfite reductase [Acidimicrobiia bacterium]
MTAIDETVHISIDEVLNRTRGRNVFAQPIIDKELDRYASMVEEYKRGEIEDDVFRVYRLGFGIYGQRQGGTNQMVRVKAPYGRVNADQLDLFARISEEYSRGWGHLTTRQNVQFHFVQLERTPELLRELNAAGITTREACGDTVRNIVGCPLAGVCPAEVLDITPWAEAAFQYFVRHPYAQRLPRKFKINFSGCSTDCGQAMFNDAGVVAVSRIAEDGSTERGFRVYVAGGLGANPRPAYALEEFTPREMLLPTLEAVLRTFDHDGNRDNKVRARMKWLIETAGWEEVQRRILRERKFLRGAATWPGGIPDIVGELGDAPAGGIEVSVNGTAIESTIGPDAVAMVPVRNAPATSMVPVRLQATEPFARWKEANVLVSGSMQSVLAHCHLGDITAAQFRGLATIVRDHDIEVRVTNRQNFVLIGVKEERLRELYDALVALDMGSPGAERARDVVSCPGADTCALSVTQSRGLANAISDQLEADGLSEVGGVRINISGCMNSCGQHHVADIGFFGLERRAHGESAPGYQLLLGGGLGDEQVQFGERVLRLPAKKAAQAVSTLVGNFAEQRTDDETFQEWLKRSGGAAEVAKSVKQFDTFESPAKNPDLYVDYDETGPFSGEVGEGECAAT